MSFQDKLDKLIQKNNSLVCIGLDSSLDRLPQCLKENQQFEFNKGIINATYHLVCSYKLNSAFYEAQGAEGIKQLKMTCDFLRSAYPEVPIILDAKRGDIGSTNDGYVQYVFDYLGADAITLSPYLGKESLEPFLRKKDKGCMILCRTSNEGAGELQDLKIGDETLYEVVARKVATDWNDQKNCFLVVGATYPEEMKRVRSIAGDITFLVPGIGAQEGVVERIVRAGLNTQKSGLIISASRSIIFSSADETFAEEARVQTEKLREEVNDYRY